MVVQPSRRTHSHHSGHWRRRRKLRHGWPTSTHLPSRQTHCPCASQAARECARAAGEAREACAAARTSSSHTQNMMWLPKCSAPPAWNRLRAQMDLASFVALMVELKDDVAAKRAERGFAFQLVRALYPMHRQSPAATLNAAKLVVLCRPRTMNFPVTGRSCVTFQRCGSCCRENAMLGCDGCRVQTYCGAECARKHAAEHARTCTREYPETFRGYVRSHLARLSPKSPTYVALRTFEAIARIEDARLLNAADLDRVRAEEVELVTMVGAHAELKGRQIEALTQIVAGMRGERA